MAIGIVEKMEMQFADDSEWHDITGASIQIDEESHDDTRIAALPISGTIEIGNYVFYAGYTELVHTIMVPVNSFVPGIISDFAEAEANGPPMDTGEMEAQENECKRRSA